MDAERILERLILLVVENIRVWLSWDYCRATSSRPREIDNEKIVLSI